MKRMLCSLLLGLALSLLLGSCDTTYNNTVQTERGNEPMIRVSSSAPQIIPVSAN